MLLKVCASANSNASHQLDINQILFHNDILYSTGDDGLIKAWSSTLELLEQVQAHECSVFSITANNEKLFSCSNDGTVRKWKLKKLESDGTLAQNSDIEFWKVFACEDVLFIGDSIANLLIYKNNRLCEIIDMAEAVKDITYSGNFVITAKDNDVVITELKWTDAGKVTYSALTYFMGRAPICIVEELLVFTSRTGRDILCYYLRGDNRFKEAFKISEGHSMIINALLALNLNGNKYVISAGWDKSVKVWQIDNDKPQSKAIFNVEFVINSLCMGKNNELFCGGANGHLVALKIQID